MRWTTFPGDRNTSQGSMFSGFVNYNCFNAQQLLFWEFHFLIHLTVYMIGFVLLLYGKIINKWYQHSMRYVFRTNFFIKAGESIRNAPDSCPDSCVGVQILLTHWDDIYVLFQYKFGYSLFTHTRIYVY